MTRHLAQNWAAVLLVIVSLAIFVRVAIAIHRLDEREERDRWR